jgi:hypothetical protein
LDVLVKHLARRGEIVLLQLLKLAMLHVQTANEETQKLTGAVELLYMRLVRIGSRWLHESLAEPFFQLGTVESEWSRKNPTKLTGICGDWPKPEGANLANGDSPKAGLPNAPRGDWPKALAPNGARGNWLKA